MQLLGNLFEYVLASGQRELNILGATSGDTGSSAEYAMRGKRGIRVFMLSPKARMSPFQTAQMYSLTDPNIFNIAIEGVFDDCQDIVKAIAADAAFKRDMRIGTVNSINWARVAAQVVYYFKGYFAATRSNDEQVSFAVPSGNFGNILAGHVARRMGLPIRRLILATNENDVLDEFFRSGRYRVRQAGRDDADVEPIDGHFQGVEFRALRLRPRRARCGQGRAICGARVERDGGFDLSGTPLDSAAARIGLRVGTRARTPTASRRSGGRRATIGIVVDPHTADGVKVGLEQRETGVPLICIETALPAKFAATIREALGREPARPPAYAGIEDRPQRYAVAPCRC